jgi:hypothetical protein
VVVLIVLGGIAAQSAFAASMATVEVKQSSLDSTVFEVTVPDVQMSQVVVGEDTFTRFLVPGANTAQLDTGRPEVPMVPVMLAVPDGASCSLTVQILEGETAAVNRVYPLQPMVPWGEEPGPFVYDSAFYDTAAVYPPAGAAQVDMGMWRTLHVLHIQVYPVRAMPNKDTVILCSAIKVKGEFRGHNT